MARAPILALALTLFAASVGRAGDIRTLREAGGEYGVRVLSYKEMPFRTVVHQQHDFSCGSAALATLLSYHFGRKFDETTIFKAMWDEGDKAQIQKVGFSLLDLKTYLKTLGLDADGYHVPLSSLLQKQAPSIVVMRTGAYKHFVVLKGAKDGYVLLGDPAFGLRTQTIKDFARDWQGIVFLIHGDRDVEAAFFNRSQDWQALTTPPLALAVREQPSASALMRDLPPIYQLTTTFNVSH